MGEVVSSRLDASQAISRPQHVCPVCSKEVQDGNKFQMCCSRMHLHPDCVTVLAACSPDRQKEILLHDCDLPVRHRSPRRGVLRPKKPSQSILFQSKKANAFVAFLFLALAYCIPLLQSQAIHKQWPADRDWIGWIADWIYGIVIVSGVLIPGFIGYKCLRWCGCCCIPGCGLCGEILFGTAEEPIEPEDSTDSD